MKFGFAMFNKMPRFHVLVRVIPYAVFGCLTLLQNHSGECMQYWVYLAKVVVGAVLIWLMRPHVEEMRWKFSWEAIAVGAGIFLVWIGLDSYYPTLFHRSVIYDPDVAFGAGSALALFFLAVRALGFTLIVPPFEEVFYRSFLYRYLIRSNFLAVPLNRFHWKSFLVTGIIFGIGHHEWLQGIVCGFAYQWLVLRKNRLGDAMTAHAVTNLLLAVWIIAYRAYRFW